MSRDKVIASGLTYNEDGPRSTWEIRRKIDSSDSEEEIGETDLAKLPQHSTKLPQNSTKLSQNSSELAGMETAIISLADSNLVVGLLPNGKKFNIVVDSGASLTLLGRDVVDSSPYLSQLPLQEISPVKICIADGNYIYSQHTIDFKCQIQGLQIPLSAHIVPPFGLVNCLLGTPDLKRLKATLDFEQDILKVKLPKSKVVKFTTPSAFYIRPHSTRLVTLKAKLPHHLNNEELELQATKAAHRLTAGNFLTSVRRGKCVVPMHNCTDKTLQLSRNACLAVTDLENLCRPVSTLEIEQKLEKYPFLDNDDTQKSSSGKLSTS